MTTLGDEFPKQQARCRELLGQYREIGPAGTFGAIMLEDVLKRADVAAVSGDVVAMIRIFEEMKQCE